MSDNNKNVTNPDKISRAEERIKANQWDVDAWNVLLRDAQNKPISESRPFFEKLIKQFPLSGQYLKSFIVAEKKDKCYENVDKLFRQYLSKIHHIELWKYYLTYIREKADNSSKFQDSIARAYDYASDHMGLDTKSFPIWTEYINFLKSAPAKNQFAESQKTNAIRRVYNRAIVTPMIGIETIWRDYNQFENSINNIIARRFIDDRSRDYMNARRVAKEYEAITKGLNRNLPSVPPQNTKEEAKQVELWKKYISWEKSNPLNTDDLLTVTKRTIFAYEQCLLCLGHHPDIWYEAASYVEEASKLLAEKGSQESANSYAVMVSEIYERGTSILKDSQLLGFAYADYEESCSRFDQVEKIYNKMIENVSGDPSLVYIQYSRFVRRSKGILAAREIFKRARLDPRTSYHIYINAAMMEHYCTKDPEVAHRIFELGLTKYMRMPEMVLAYVDYLDHLNEDNNTRVLFERCLGTGHMTAEQARPIWDKFLQFESFVGDLASILKVERRRLAASNSSFQVAGATIQQPAAFSVDKSMLTARVVDRYKFGTLFPCNDSELKSMGYVHHQIIGQLGVESQTVTQSEVSSISPAIGGLDIKPNLSGTPRPDFNQMLPFKPRAYPRTGAHPVPGGEFPPPPSLSNMISILPPPSCFTGPFPTINGVLEHVIEAGVPEWFSHPPAAENMTVDDGTALSIETAASQLLRKRRRIPSAVQEADPASNIGENSSGTGVGGNTSDDESDANNTRPSMIPNNTSNTNIPVIQTSEGYIVDIFKIRQQKRQKVTNLLPTVSIKTNFN